ncbi:unnamed protein product [Hymenolepis diminuta]|uniref:Uncharacterized protein n=1 Tax=Hymenolepis diminuta TaxID=6216 RepID=A0A564YPW6_HYMDI|nr:unnamed protein product [Hymenolepis diminuta]
MTILDKKKTMSEETYTPSPQMSQVNPANLRDVFMVLESHLELRKYHSKAFPNPYDDLKTAILQHIQPSAAERVEKLLQQECVEELRSSEVFNTMKLFAPGESFDTDYWKPCPNTPLDFASFLQPPRFI